MAYDQYLRERISRTLDELQVNYNTKSMMGGFVFSVDEKMLCGIHIDKKYGDSLLMVRIGEEATQEALKKNVCLPMDFTGRPMKGYVYITPEGIDMEEDLQYWLELALSFNPFAKASKRRASKIKKQ